jgi:hypothetical protein
MPGKSLLASVKLKTHFSPFNEYYALPDPMYRIFITMDYRNVWVEVQFNFIDH